MYMGINNKLDYLEKEQFCQEYVNGKRNSKRQ